MIGPLHGFQNVSRMVFSHHARDLVCFADSSKHSMESAHHFSSRPDCNNTAEVPSFALRPALSTIPFVSDLCGVDVQSFQERSSQALPNSKELSSVNDFWFPIRLQELLQASLFLVKFLFCTDTPGSHWVAKSCTTIAYR